MDKTYPLCNNKVSMSISLTRSHPMLTENARVFRKCIPSTKEASCFKQFRKVVELMRYSSSLWHGSARERRCSFGYAALGCNVSTWELQGKVCGCIGIFCENLKLYQNKAVKRAMRLPFLLGLCKWLIKSLHSPRKLPVCFRISNWRVTSSLDSLILDQHNWFLDLHHTSSSYRHAFPRMFADAWVL